MKYEPVKYNNREEALAALRGMIKRKKEKERQVQEDFAKARKESANCYAGV